MTGLKPPTTAPANAAEHIPVKVAAGDYTTSSCIMGGEVVVSEDENNKLTWRRRKIEMTQVGLRVTCMVTSATAMAFMVTAEEDSIASVYGFHLPVRSKWSFSNSFEYLVGVSAAVAAHCFLQLLIIGATRLCRYRNRPPTIASRKYTWLLFAADQVFSYATMSAGSASSGVTNLNRTGIRHTALPNFCKPLRRFCDHVTVSIVLTFVSCILLAVSTVLDVIWLSKY